MKLLDVVDLAPVQRPLAVAQGDGGQSRIAGDFPLAWCNTQACSELDLATFWFVDDTSAPGILATAALGARHARYPTGFGLGPPFRNLVAGWVCALADPNTHG